MTTQDNAGIPLGGHLPADAVLRAAGVLLIDPTGNGLFLRRTYDGDHPTEWSLPGGKVEPNESPAQAAIRELEEETGITGIDPLALKLLDRDVKDGVDYTTFYYQVKEMHSPKLNSEHNGYAWTPIEAPPEPTHPGLKSTVKKRLAAQDQRTDKGKTVRDTIKFPPPPNEDGERNVDYMFKRGGADAGFKEEDHPRGQPGNKGQFGPGGAGGGGESNSSKSEPFGGRLTPTAKAMMEKAIQGIATSGSEFNMGYMERAERQKFFEELGHSKKTFGEVNQLLDNHSSVKSLQEPADRAIAEHVTKMDDVGKLLADMATYEEAVTNIRQAGEADRKKEAQKEFADDWEMFGNHSAYDNWQEQWDTEEAYKWKGPSFELFRKGDTSSPTQSWTTNPRGADMGGGSIGANRKSNLESLRKQGYRPVAGYSRMVGAPGESEVFMVKFPQQATDEHFDLETNIAPKAAELNTTTMDYLKFAADKNPRSIESFILNHGRAFDKKSDDNATESIR